MLHDSYVMDPNSKPGIKYDTKVEKSRRKRTKSRDNTPRQQYAPRINRQTNTIRKNKYVEVEIHEKVSIDRPKSASTIPNSSTTTLSKTQLDMGNSEKPVRTYPSPVPNRPNNHPVIGGSSRDLSSKLLSSSNGVSRRLYTLDNFGLISHPVPKELQSTLPLTSPLRQMPPLPPSPVPPPPEEPPPPLLIPSTRLSQNLPPLPTINRSTSVGVISGTPQHHGSSPSTNSPVLPSEISNLEKFGEYNHPLASTYCGRTSHQPPPKPPKSTYKVMFPYNEFNYGPLIYPDVTSVREKAHIEIKRIYYKRSGDFLDSLSSSEKSDKSEHEGEKSEVSISIPGVTLEYTPEKVDDNLDPKAKIAIELFNKKFKNGIKYLLEEGMITDDPKSIAQFLTEHNERLSKKELGEILAENSSDGVELLTAFTELMNFSTLSFDQALRIYLTKFMLSGEAQKISRIMEVFAAKYCHDNPNFFPNTDAAFVLAFALIMLNTDRHNPAIAEKDKMTKTQFIKNVSGTWSGQDPPLELLEKMYNEIVCDEIQMKTKGDPDKKGWVKAIKTTGYEKGRIWVCLIGNELRWYKNPTLGKGETKTLGMIKLEYVTIREQEDRFSITSTLPKNIEFFVYEKGKQIIMSSFEFSVTCETEQHVEHWAKTVRQNVTFEIEPDFNPKDFKKPKSKANKKTKKF